MKEKTKEVIKEKYIYNTMIQNVRDTPKGIITGTLYPGTVEVLESVNNWSRVSAGWIENKWLEERE